MNAASPEQIRIAIEAGWPMRLGRKLKRTLYLHHPADPDVGGGIVVGMVDSEALAEAIMLRWNLHGRHVERATAKGSTGSA